MRRKICGVLAQALGALGFRSASKSATQSGSLVEKDLADGWCLVWSVDFANLRREPCARTANQISHSASWASGKLLAVIRRPNGEVEATLRWPEMTMSLRLRRGPEMPRPA
jgi:hypothetical protein